MVLSPSVKRQARFGLENYIGSLSTTDCLSAIDDSLVQFSESRHKQLEKLLHPSKGECGYSHFGCQLSTKKGSRKKKKIVGPSCTLFLVLRQSGIIPTLQFLSRRFSFDLDIIQS